MMKCWKDLPVREGCAVLCQYDTLLAADRKEGKAREIIGHRKMMLYFMENTERINMEIYFILLFSIGSIAAVPTTLGNFKPLIL